MVIENKEKIREDLCDNPTKSQMFSRICTLDERLHELEGLPPPQRYLSLVRVHPFPALIYPASELDSEVI